MARRWPVISGLLALALAAGLGSLAVARSSGLTEIDTEWMNEVIEHRAPFWDIPALFMNALGGGVIGVIVVPVLLSAVLLLLKRPWAAGYFLGATILSAGIVQLLKHFFGRARPLEILVTSDFGSFPSGHVANAATMAMVLAVLFPRVWVWAVGVAYTIIMLLSRTYLGAHWLTDTIGGLLIGLGVAFVVWAPLAAKLDGERRLARRHPLGDSLPR
ncbi:undecaprenyl-diphosphatase [Cryobacterium psychrophilum]|uniref:Phosphatase PAP2 family protein n=2 Tax=Cryobacterium psychrophilum TaxID=41988 RepID=A0A4Y8KPH2_9MICO|nr:undecaprenyl-diphosphatase [Cryobacterium psychrophilum]TFD76341.1 phosphatase PAP2 family protein [Cryobacterium psychrophilum]